MSTLLLIFVIVLALAPVVPQSTSTEVNEISIVSFKCFRTQRGKRAQSESVSPEREMIKANKNFERNARINDPAGARDPNEDTLDNRRDALDKSINTARTTPPKEAGLFAYVAKLHNGGSAPVEMVFWEYQFIDPADPSSATRRQFLCRVNIKPGKDKELEAFSLSGAANTISATSERKPLHEKVVINRVEYAAGENWQRKDWDIKEILTTYDRAMSRPWLANEMCRGL